MNWIFSLIYVENILIFGKLEVSRKSFSWIFGHFILICKIFLPKVGKSIKVLQSMEYLYQSLKDNYQNLVFTMFCLQISWSDLNHKERQVCL